MGKMVKQSDQGDQIERILAYHRVIVFYLGSLPISIINTVSSPNFWLFFPR
jgi:hypothetical protein